MAVNHQYKGGLTDYLFVPCVYFYGEKISKTAHFPVQIRVHHKVDKFRGGEETFHHSRGLAPVSRGKRGLRSSL